MTQTIRDQAGQWAARLRTHQSWAGDALDGVIDGDDRFEWVTRGLANKQLNPLARDHAAAYPYRISMTGDKLGLSGSMAWQDCLNARGFIGQNLHDYQQNWFTTYETTAWKDLHDEYSTLCIGVDPRKHQLGDSQQSPFRNAWVDSENRKIDWENMAGFFAAVDNPALSPELFDIADLTDWAKAFTEGLGGFGGVEGRDPPPPPAPPAPAPPVGKGGGPRRRPPPPPPRRAGGISTTVILVGVGVVVLVGVAIYFR